jgi:hypothetical protein
MHTHQNPSEPLLAQASRLASIEAELGRAYQSRDIATLRQFREQFDAPELQALRSGTELWGRVQRALELGALPEAASIARESVEILVVAAKSPTEVSWWSPHQEAVTFGAKMLSAPQLLAEQDFSKAIVQLLRYAGDLTPRKLADQSKAPEDFQNFAARAADAVRLYSGFHALLSEEQLLSNPSLSAPTVRALLCGAVGIDLLTGAREALATLERAYHQSIRAEDRSRPSADFLPLVRAAIDLESIEPGAMASLSERLVTAAEADPSFGKAALVALHYQHHHLLQGQSADAARDQEFQTLVERLFRLSLRDQSSGAFATIPLFQRTEQIQSALVELAQDTIKHSLLEFLDLHHPEEGSGYGDAIAEELEEDPGTERPEVGRELSSIPLEEFPFYRVAPILRALSEGRFHGEDLSLGFGSDRELLSGIDRRFTPSPARAIAIAGALIGLNTETPELTTPELVELFRDAELALALRPTREDVSEPTCFAGVLLGAMEELTRTRHTDDDELRAILVEAIEDERLFVTKNVWWDPSSGEKAFDQGLPPMSEEEFEEDAEDRQLQVGEERDHERTKALLAALRPGGAPLPSVPLTDEDSPLKRSSDSRPVSMSALRTSQELIAEVIAPGTYAGLTFDIVELGIGLLDRSSNAVGVVVYLADENEELRRNLESELSKLVPTPVKVERRDPITIR